MKNRKAFNFYRSYYEVVKALPDNEKLQLLMAILDKQFLDIEPRLVGLPELMYKSQKHSIDKQVDGYKSKMKITTPSLDPTEGPTEGLYLQPTQGPTGGPCQDPSVQGEGKGQEKEKVQVQGEGYRFLKYNKLKDEYEFEFLTKAQKEKLNKVELLKYNTEERIFNKTN